MDRRWSTGIAAALAAAGVLSATACGALDAGGARDTMSALPPPGQGVTITQATVPPTVAPTVTTLAPGQTLPSDDADPLSVASRFLNAAATGDGATGNSLQVGGMSPDTFEWAVSTYQSTVDVAGVTAWGGPSCAPPEGSAVRCSWLVNDPGTSLVLVQDGTTWRVSHPLNVPSSTAPAPIGSGCVVGGVAVNLRGGPATTWPRFTQVPPGTCDLKILDLTSTDSEGTWRLVQFGPDLGWIVERVLRYD